MRKALITRLILFFLLFGSTGALCEPITLATMNWEPFYGEKLPENGFFAALSREAFKRCGFELKLVFLPWKRALTLAKNGEYDGLLGAYYSEERTRYFHFPNSVSRNEEVFVKKKGRPIPFSRLEDLKPYTIGTLRGGAQSEDLLKHGLVIKETNDYESSIKKLNANRIDLLLIGKQAFYFILTNQDDLRPLKENFDILAPPYKFYDLYCPITRKRPDGKSITTSFNRALREMRIDGTYDRILSRFGQK